MLSQSDGRCTNTFSNTGKYTSKNTLKIACGYKYSTHPVVQVWTFINFLTSEFGASTWRERERYSSLRSFVSYYTNKTQTLGTSCGVLYLLSSSLVGIQKRNRMPQRSKNRLLNTMVGTQLLLSVYMARSQLPTLDSMAKNSIFYAES